MTAVTQCSRVGKTLSGDVAEGQCPSCLMEMAISTLNDAETVAYGKSVPPSPDEISLPGLEVIELIGRGGMGAVYTARQVNLDRIVAVKLLSNTLADNPVLAERIVREAKSLAQLKHPHIVAAYDAGMSGELSYLVIEYIDGADLATLIVESGLATPDNACEWIRQAADALGYTHQQGFVHRDIKPSNLLLDEGGQVLVSDPGLVGATQPDVRTSESSLTEAG